MTPRRLEMRFLEDPARTSIAAVISFLIARLLRMPESYWATISTIVIMQSTLGATLLVSWQRFAGTVLGAATGALISNFFQINLAMFGVGLFVLGLLCRVLRLGIAYRFAGVTLTITMLISRNQPAWIVGEHRLIEVSVGILVGLIVSAAWPLPDSLNKETGTAGDQLASK